MAASTTNRNQIKQVIDDGIAILRQHTPPTYIATHPSEENKFIWTLHYIFQQNRNLLHSVFDGSEDHGIELTDANVTNIATLKVAEVTRKQLNLVVGGLWSTNAEKKFDRITKEYILDSLYKRTLMTHLASVSKKEFNSKRKRILSDTIEYVKDELTKNLFNVWDYICEEKSYKRSYTLLQPPSRTVFHMDVVNVIKALQSFCKADVTIDDPEQIFSWFREQESRTPEQILEEIEENLANMRDSIIYYLVGEPLGDDKTMLQDFTKSVFDNEFWKKLFFQLNTKKLLIRKIAYEEKITEYYARLLDEARGNYAGGKKRKIRLKGELRF